MTALPGALRYLQATARAGMKRAVVSASANTLPMLELAGLATLVEERVDAETIRPRGCVHAPPRMYCSPPAATWGSIPRRRSR